MTLAGTCVLYIDIYYDSICNQIFTSYSIHAHQQTYSSPDHLQLLSVHYSWIEWGILFRPDLEGTPRYASAKWVQSLVEVNKASGQIMRLAAHLCQSRCQEVLEGNSAFISELKSMGFGRVQINATAGSRS